MQIVAINESDSLRTKKKDCPIVQGISNDFYDKIIGCETQLTRTNGSALIKTLKKDSKKWEMPHLKKFADR